MATLTSAPKALIVLVIISVTGNASRTLLNTIFGRLGMASAASLPFVGTIELKIGLCIVIEQPELPIIRRVATSAIGT